MAVFALGAGIVVGGVFEMAIGILLPRWKPGDYARLVDVGFECVILGGVVMLLGVFYG